MRKIIYITIIFFVTVIFGTLIFLTTIGIKTNNFNVFINEKLNEINPKIELKLKDVNFKLNLSNLEFIVLTLDPKLGINDKIIELELIEFDLNIFDYLNSKNPISKISVVSKENNIVKFVDFINEYDFNIARSIILKQIRKGKVKISSDFTFDENKPNKLKYLINGSVTDTEIKLLNKSKIDGLNFKFQINENIINLNNLSLLIDKIFISSQQINIKKINEQFEINGKLKTKKTKINLKKYSKAINANLDILDNKLINLSSDNNLSFKINNKLKVKDLIINSKLNFDEIYTNSKYQDYIYLKNGNILINYSNKLLNIKLDSNFLFKKDKYNNVNSSNLIKLFYNKKQNADASVKISLTNSDNKINSNEFKKFIFTKNFNLPDQDITFSSENNLSFNLSKNNKIKNFAAKSNIKTDNTLINLKSQRVKKYFSNFKNQVNFSQSNFDIDFSENKLIFSLKSKYSINNIYENIILTVEKENNNYSFEIDVDLDSAEIQIDELDYIKDKDIKSKLYVNGLYKSNNEITIKHLKFEEEEKNILIKNLEITKNDKIKNIDLFKINLLNKFGKLNELELKKVNTNYYLTGSKFDGTKNIQNILDNSSKSIFSNFKNLNAYIFLDIGKYFINFDSYLSNVRGEIQIKNNKVFNSNIDAKLDNKRKFKLNIFTNNKKQKITNLDIERPEPFIKNFKFIKGFKEGRLLYESNELDGKTTSNLKIFDFKVQEVSVLAKLLTLASLQGIADLLTGEGIRFSDFEMNYQTLGNTTTIKEIYAIGPAISLMMEGYVVKDNLTSLKGTLVPATTINKTISKIPMLGEILVGRKIGEGVFGVSFKIKGPPTKLKTTVNPIKTLTPRFITRTLEQISN